MYILLTRVHVLCDWLTYNQNRHVQWDEHILTVLGSSCWNYAQVVNVPEAHRWRFSCFHAFMLIIFGRWLRFRKTIEMFWYSPAISTFVLRNNVWMAIILGELEVNSVVAVCQEDCSLISLCLGNTFSNLTSNLLWNQRLCFTKLSVAAMFSTQHNMVR